MRGCFWSLVWVCAVWGLFAIGNLIVDFILSLNVLMQGGLIVCGVAFIAFLIMKGIDQLD
jgi:hypothetical protein